MTSAASALWPSAPARAGSPAPARHACARAIAAMVRRTELSGFHGEFAGASSGCDGFRMQSAVVAAIIRASNFPANHGRSSKWATSSGAGRTGQRRGKIFSKLIREISVAPVWGVGSGFQCAPAVAMDRARARAFPGRHRPGVRSRCRSGVSTARHVRTRAMAPAARPSGRMPHGQSQPHCRRMRHAFASTAAARRRWLGGLPVQPGGP